MNVSLQTKNKMVLMLAGTPMPTKTRVQRFNNVGVKVSDDIVALGAAVSYTNGQAGSYTVNSQNQTDDGTTVGPASSQVVTFADPVSIPVADGVDVVYPLV